MNAQEKKDDVVEDDADLDMDDIDDDEEDEPEVDDDGEGSPEVEESDTK